MFQVIQCKLCDKREWERENVWQTNRITEICKWWQPNVFALHAFAHRLTDTLAQLKSMGDGAQWLCKYWRLFCSADSLTRSKWCYSSKQSKFVPALFMRPQPTVVSSNNSSAEKKKHISTTFTISRAHLIDSLLSSINFCSGKEFIFVSAVMIDELCLYCFCWCCEISIVYP